MKQVGAFSLSLAFLVAEDESRETGFEELRFEVVSMAKVIGKKRFLREIKRVQRGRRM